MSQLPRAARTRRGTFAVYEIGYFHMDIAELRTARERAYQFVATDRTSTVAFARVYRRDTGLVADYLAAYDDATHLTALRWRTPVETLEALWAAKAELVRRSPARLTLGPDT